MDDSKKSNCGYTGISYEKCKALGCCYGGTNLLVPLCYFPQTGLTYLLIRNYICGY